MPNSCWPAPSVRLRHALSSDCCFKVIDDRPIDTARLLDEASEALQQNRDLLQIALDQMQQGITVLDRDFRLTCWNRQYRALFDLPDEMGQVGVSLDHILPILASAAISAGRPRCYSRG